MQLLLPCVVDHFALVQQMIVLRGEKNEVVWYFGFPSFLKPWGEVILQSLQEKTSILVRTIAFDQSMDMDKRLNESASAE